MPALGARPNGIGRTGTASWHVLADPEATSSASCASSSSPCGDSVLRARPCTRLPGRGKRHQDGTAPPTRPRNRAVKTQVTRTREDTAHRNLQPGARGRGGCTPRAGAREPSRDARAQVLSDGAVGGLTGARTGRRGQGRSADGRRRLDVQGRGLVGFTVRDGSRTVNRPGPFPARKPTRTGSGA